MGAPLALHSKVRSIILYSAGFLLLGGCGPEHSSADSGWESDLGDSDLSDAAAATSISPGALGLPRREQLQPLQIAVDVDQPLRSMFASNNPETVTSYGILASTFHDNAGQRGDTKRYPNTAAAPVAELVGSRAIDDACPAGAVRELDVYIAHILDVPGYIGLGIWPAADATIEVSGDLASGPWDTRSENFVSAKVARDFFFFRQRTTRSMRVSGGGYQQIDAAVGDGYVDGRLRLRSDGACFWAFTMAQPEPSATELPSEAARGNVAWPGWYNGEGQGRIAGVYRGVRLVGEQRFALPGPGYLRGYELNTLSQATRARFHWGDSAEVNYGNYGTLYDQTFEVENTGSACMKLRAELVSYALVGPSESPTYDIYNQREKLPSIYWNGPVVKETAQGLVLDHAVLYPEKNPSTPKGTVQTMRKGLDLVRLEPGASARLRYLIPVPGLISAEAAFVFTGEPCS